MRGWWCSTRAMPPTRGADDPHPHARWSSARREGGLWRVDARGRADGASDEISARLLVNAAGPWVDEVLSDAVGLNARAQCPAGQGQPHRRRRSFRHDRAYFFQNADGRIIFAIPYEDDFTLIGTTDQDYRRRSRDSRDQRRGDRLSLRGGQRIFRASRSRRPTSSGPIPACARSTTTAPAKAQEATRDYVLKVDSDGGDGRRSLNVFGGKITTYRRLAEAVLEKIERRSSASAASRGPRTRRCPAATFRSTASSAEVDRSCRAPIAFLDARLARAAGPALRHARARAAWPCQRRRCRSRAATSAPISTRPRCAI